MIDSLRGTLLDLDEDSATLDVGGIRFRLDVPASTARQLPAPGQAAELKTRLSFNVNEGTFQLFGFATEEERGCFDTLTRISGIGPRKGLMLLSQIEIASFAQAILRSDIAYLAKIKGVGKKTAERLIVELREAMVPYAAAAPTPSGPALPDTARDAIQGLMVLGCPPAKAERAVAEALEALGEGATTETLIREGLRRR
ncbi:MAG: Holliday junction branch migration protein RuvA [Candidatus Sumerlaeia bacterium]|nr:Holliday junction branch migration protein RuvA [Candidatus Sumerlaeia bacterium]